MSMGGILAFGLMDFWDGLLLLWPDKNKSMLHIIWSIIVGFVVGLIARAILPGAQHLTFIPDPEAFHKRVRARLTGPRRETIDHNTHGDAPKTSRRKD